MNALQHRQKHNVEMNNEINNNLCTTRHIFPQMCGILCSLHFIKNKSEATDIDLIKHTKNLLQNRGPDFFSEHHIEWDDVIARFYGFVLWQQGIKAKIQPLVSQDHVLLFNGDIYSTEPLESKSSTQSDTEWLFNKIIECKDDREFMSLMKQIKGPFSLIYFNIQKKQLYFARDSLGRQTLLIGCHQNCIHITSVASKKFGTNSFVEVPPIGIFCLELNTNSYEFDITLRGWQDVSSHQYFTEQIKSVEELLKRKILVQDTIEPCWMMANYSRLISFSFHSILTDDIEKSPFNILTKLSQNQEVSSTCDALINLLTKSVNDRVNASPPLCKNCIKSTLLNGLQEHSSCTHPKIGILFSGGIDCSILAVLADKFIDKTTGIDLINVSFEKIVRNQSKTNENYETPDRLTSRQTLDELIQLCPERRWNLVEVNVTREQLKDALESKISDLCYPLNSILDESLGAALWFAANTKGKIIDVNYESPCRVLLIGSGADELFGGYTRHRNAFLRSGHSWENLDNELNLDWTRLPSRNLARDDRIIGDNGVTARSPYVEEDVAFFVRNLKSSQKCFHILPEGIGDKLLLRLCGFKLGLRNVCWLKKRALQFGSRVADRKQNAKDVSDALR